MATIHIDGKTYEAKAGENLLEAILSQHLDLPYFCWHPSMGSIGACRQCAIITYSDENDTRGRIGMACMTSVTDGMRVSVEAPLAKDFRSTVIEWLMENHPHDCPVCEEGGECHLQDMTVMTGHSMRRYTGTKRTWENQNLGPFIGHEMNRCITCYRCVRFYDEYAGGTDLAAFGSRGRMYFGRFEDGTLESEFAGNLVEVCPTGVFTDKPFAQSYTRKWDLQSAPSICVGCAVGCNVFPAERYGDLKRITNRYHGELNGYFLCDRGRFGSHFVNHEKRIKHAGVRTRSGDYEFGDVSNAIKVAGATLRDGAIGIGSPRASFENNFALRELVGAENFCTGIIEAELEVIKTALDVISRQGIVVPSLKQVDDADAILILGEDIANTAARTALSVRQAVRTKSFEMATDAHIPTWQDAGVRGHAKSEKSALFIATPATTRLDDIATQVTSGSVSELVAFGSSICTKIRSSTASSDDFAGRVASTLRTAKAPLIITGSSLQSIELVQVAANICFALQEHDQPSSFLFVPAEVNSVGVSLLEGGLSLSTALQRMEEGKAAVVLENDLYFRAPAESVDSALGPGNFVVLDTLENRTAEHASVVFPAATYAEQTGTFVNYETRAQRFYQVFNPQDEIAPAWLWLSQLAETLGTGATWESYASVLDQCAEHTYSQLREIAPSSDYRIGTTSRIPRQSHRYSGRTAMNAQVNIHEPKAKVDTDTPFSYSMEGQNPGDQNGATIPYVWSPGWNSNQSVFKFQQEVAGKLAGGDPGLRLIESNGAQLQYFDVETPELSRRDGSFEVIPLHLVFGSDEMSNQSWPIRARVPAPFVLLSQQDATNLGVKSGMGLKVEGITESLEVQVDSRLPSGVIGLPQGLAEIPQREIDRVHLSVDQEFVVRTNVNPEVIAKG
ncbi:MAG: NADH-quinone oxidoreductase subunit NuoG [Gammaproteobacteria bacterium]|nr:NADH-quinone oxidoreductase subunit NuoG [Gammaproteobacteria bacterium]